MFLHEVAHEDILGRFDEDVDLEEPIAQRIDRQVEELKDE